MTTLETSIAKDVGINMTSGRDVYLEKFAVESPPLKEGKMKSLKQIAEAVVNARNIKDEDFLDETIDAMEVELQRMKDRECNERVSRDRHRPAED